MLCKRTFLCFAVGMLLSASAVWAGDAASFVDLGFSPDNTVYMFGQYGVQSGTLKPWADIFTVDIARNNFVNGGKISYIHDSSVVAGNDGAGALYRLITQNSAFANQYRISYLNVGQPLYIAVNGAGNPGESIEFRDFTSGNSYKANLVNYTEGTGQDI
ncbi:MAG: DUF2259 domain-containing protein, partial [Treponema sp.]|nr:DUF2259 domain-containing protein [Treponema sp.]